MTLDSPTATFSLVPRGPFSLRLAAGHAFGPRQDARDEDQMRLAFCVDGFHGLAGVVLRQDPDGAVTGELRGDADVGVVRAQVARILSLDHDGAGWPAAGVRDPVLGRIQARFPGFRPVLFASPYEAAAWSVLYGRKSHAQVRRLRDRVAGELGGEFELAGRRLSAFPTPDRLRSLGTLTGVPDQVTERLRAVAEWALEGRLDPDRLRALDPDAAMAELRELRGVGPFFAGLILIRAAGPVDVLAPEPRLLDCVARYYGGEVAGPERLGELAEPWRPYRTWAAVALRRAGYEDGIR
ncbi:MAG: DNA-3-methyladenine glycosylase 2 family protein [bacterium]|jgi:DNA-3-methyladenine glycosylase II|nr:DNA-3-methyladenine glycosylase 2 family protein [bacterium]